MLLVRLIVMLCISVSVLIPATAQTQNTEAFPSLSQVFFSSPSKGWILGSTSEASFIFCSTDGGENWQEQYKSNLGVYKMKFFDEQVGWAVGQSGLILHTEDGGKSWSKQISGVKEKLNSLSIINKHVVYIVGDNGIVLSTDDGGVSWGTYKLNTELPLQNIEFIDENIGYIAAIECFFYTEDSGRRWERKNINYGKNLFFITFSSKNNGWIGTDRSLLRTEDSGENWQEVDITQPGYMCGPIFIDPKYGWLAKSDGSEGSIVHVEGNNDKKSFSYILSTNDGGNSWKEQLFIESNENHKAWILDIFFLNTLDGWIVGRDGLVMLTIDGGQTWAKTTINNAH